MAEERGVATPEGVLAAADRIYAANPAGFVSVRDGAAKELGKADAGAVKRFRKPTLGAWAINQWVRQEQQRMQELIDVGATLREATSNLDGDQVRALTKQRRQLTAAMTTRVRQLASRRGVSITSSVGEAIEETLTAIMLDPRAAEAAQSGMLLTTLRHTGVDDADPCEQIAYAQGLGRVPAPVEEDDDPRHGLHAVPDLLAEEKARAAAAASHDEAAAALVKAEAELEAAQERLNTVEASALEKQVSLEGLRRRVADLEEALDALDDEIGEAEQARDEVQLRATEAQTELDQAKKALRELD